MGDTKSFMQVEMADICAKICGTTESDLGIHVRAIEVNHSTTRMHDVANFPDGIFENPVC